MKHRSRHYPETKPHHCYDWVSGETVIKHALAALYTVARAYDNLPSDPLGMDAQFKNGRYWFGEEVAALFRAKLMDEGYRTGVPGFGPEFGAVIAGEYGPGQVFSSSTNSSIAANASLFYPRRNLRMPPDIHRTLFMMEQVPATALFHSAVRRHQSA